MKRVSAGRGRRPKQHKLLMRWETGGDYKEDTIRMSRHRGRGRCSAEKTARKLYRCQCSTDGCTSTAYKGGGVCKRHGAKIKRCNSEGCTNQVVKGGVCHRHGAKRKRAKTKTKIKRCSCSCSREGCTNQVRQKGVCMRHIA